MPLCQNAGVNGSNGNEIKRLRLFEMSSYDFIDEHNNPIKLSGGLFLFLYDVFEKLSDVYPDCND